MVVSLSLSLPKWKCYRCGYVYEQEAPPETCSNCNARVSFWIDWTEARSPLDEPSSKYMSPGVVTIDINRSVLDAGRLMKEKNLGEVLVSQNGAPIGILTERDILNKVVAEDLPTGHVLVRKVMSSPLVSIEEDTPARKAIEIMQERGFRRLLVTKGGKPVGMITLQGLVKPVLSSNAV